ncbi:hypothetical protein LIER_20401 [Lithospermum erythrorhizon]|uniref:Uncharacterized protein n=1 Tax=Lithospermum erythrorhizon TaxID=34254 RepID=A0AAV3QME3_LITER
MPPKPTEGSRIRPIASTYNVMIPLVCGGEGGFKIASPSSSPPSTTVRHMVALLAPRASPGRAAYDVLEHILYWREIRRVGRGAVSGALQGGRVGEGTPGVTPSGGCGHPLSLGAGPTSPGSEEGDRRRRGMSLTSLPVLPERERGPAPRWCYHLIGFHLALLGPLPVNPALAEEYRRRCPAGWLDNTTPFPVSRILPAP